MSMASTSNQIDSSSSSSSTPPSLPWGVFLSFRGEDTRKTFTGHLYSALDRAGIQTFMDDPELSRGEEISPQLLKAIQESKVSIVVFSKNYASSTWCLAELVKILECKRTMGQQVLPVFYDVDPSVVRHKKGSFAQAFESHKERFGTNKEIVEKWEGALTEASNLRGYDLQKDANGDEAKLIKTIVQDVLPEVNQVDLNVAKQPVGIESRVARITPLLSIDTNDIRRIGIYGMGGIGKTTIAKALFNKNYRCFEGSCFLANVREASEVHNGILRLQEQLLKDILKVEIKVENVYRGISLLKERLCSKKVLIVLDDLDHLSLSHQLAGQWNQFAPGSRIIITTRDAAVLDQIKVKERYNVDELDEDESLELFSRHAFEKSAPSEEYMEISKDIVRQAGGLPLALEVLGSYLFKRAMKEWESSRDKLRQIPRHRIQEKLMISYDALGDGDLKDVFLDIACFFVGEHKDIAISKLDSCGFDSEIEIKILTDRCLLSINDVEELRMHDLLRDMGREIVNKESPKKPGKRSRLWSSEDIYNVLKKQKGTEAVKGIIIPYEEMLQQVTLNTETFKKMDDLRLLDISYVRLTGSFEHLFEELRWLSWRGCDLQCLPSDFRPEKLVILDLQYSNINILWHGILFLEQLKILNLDGCEFLKTTPDFTGVPNLEELRLRDCTSLVEIHSSIGHLSKLAFLDLSNCTPITKLPDSIGRLSGLEYLNLSFCSNLRTLPSSLCNLRVLKFLHLYNCYNLEELPEELRNIESLRVLNLSCCRNLKNIPSCIWKLPLRRLAVSSCEISDGNLSDNIGSLSSLYRLVLSSCEISDGNLLDNIWSLSSLKELILSSNSFSTLPFSLGQLSNLEELDLANCSRLVEIQGLEKLTSIRSIDLQGCNNLATTFTETFFQVYSGFGKEIRICLPTRDCPGWVGHQIKGTTICFDVPQNSENKFLGMILWLVPGTELPWTWVVVENKTNGQRADDRWLRPYGKACHSVVMFIPKTVFAVKFGDKIEASIRGGQKLIIERFGVHLVYKTDSSTIENY